MTTTRSRSVESGRLCEWYAERFKDTEITGEHEMNLLTEAVERVIPGTDRVPKTMPELAQEALAIQDTCNLLGVSKAFARAMDELRGRLECDGLPHGTREIREHYVTVLWMSKLADLCGFWLEDVNANQRIGDAMRWCEETAEKLPLVVSVKAK